MRLIPFTQHVVPGVRTVWVSRHGRTTGNERRVHQGWAGTQLSPGGLADAVAARSWWAGIAVNWVLTSPVRRAVQTGEVLFGAVDDIDSGWVESAIPGIEGLTYAQAYAARPDLAGPDGWGSPDRGRDPAAEHAATISDRVLGALRRAAGAVAPGEQVAVVTHGSALESLVNAARRGQPAESAFAPDNLAVLELLVDPGAGWTLLAVHSPLASRVL
jgi:broad specificity phosphatase PhoE